jgi:hypothetical protein
MDDNLTYLEGLSTGLSSSISGLSFSFILGVGNETGGNNIVMSNGDTIDAASGGGQLDLRNNGFDDNVLLSNDGGVYSDSQLNLSTGYVELTNYATGGELYMYADKITLQNTDSTLIFGGNDTFGNLSNQIRSDNFNIRCASLLGPIGPTSSTIGEFQIVGGSHSTYDTNYYPVYISTRNASTDTTLGNTVILGGNGMNISGVKAKSNNVYVPSITIQEGGVIDSLSGDGQLNLRYDGTDDHIRLGATVDKLEFRPGVGATLLTSSSMLIQSTLKNTITASEIELNAPLIDIHGDIEITNDKTINAANGDGQLDLRYGGDDKVMLSTDAGAYSKEYLTMEPGYIEISAVDTGGSMINMFADEYDVGLQLGSGGASVRDWGIYGPGASINGLAGLDAFGDYRMEISSDRIDFINVIKLLLPDIPTYADNATAVAASHPTDAIYKTATGELRIVV